jgi:hypothetical protein
MAGQPKHLASSDEPLRRIPLVPLDCVAIVHRKLVVKVMVSLPESDDRSNKMIPGSQFIIKRRFTQPVRKRVHAEHALQRHFNVSPITWHTIRNAYKTNVVYDRQSEEPRVIKTPTPVSPPYSRNDRR